MNDEKITLDLVIDVQKDFRQYRIILSADTTSELRQMLSQKRR